jgi:hypothetical protein
VTAIKQTLQTRWRLWTISKIFCRHLDHCPSHWKFDRFHQHDGFSERRKEIGIFRTVRFRKSHVVRIIFLEALIVGLIAGIVGYALGLGISHIIGPMITGVKGSLCSLILSWPSGYFPVFSHQGSFDAYPAIHASKWIHNGIKSTLN